MEYQSLKVDIPKELHKKFKVTCVMQETTMAEVIAKLIEEWLEKLEEEKENPG